MFRFEISAYLYITIHANNHIMIKDNPEIQEALAYKPSYTSKNMGYLFINDYKFYIYDEIDMDTPWYCVDFCDDDNNLLKELVKKYGHLDDKDIEEELLDYTVISEKDPVGEIKWYFDMGCVEDRYRSFKSCDPYESDCIYDIESPDDIRFYYDIYKEVFGNVSSYDLRFKYY